MSVRDAAGGPFLAVPRPRPLLRGLAVLGLLAASSCAVRHVDFRPRERVDGESASGHESASYELVARTHGGPSELHVWSEGATRGDAEVSLRVGFEIENRFDAPCAVDLEATRLVDVEYAAADDQQRLPRELTGPRLLGASTGDAVVAPGDVGRVELVYALPPGVEPADVRAFTLSWTVSSPEVFEQSTPFTRASRPSPTRPFGGVYTGFYPFGFYRGYYGYRRPFPSRYCPPVYGY